MEDYEIIGWPEVQDFMQYDDFFENAALIDSNSNIGIGSSTYLISKEWLESLGEDTEEE